jgi:protein tyrosine/serine phosphatase
MHSLRGVSTRGDMADGSSAAFDRIHNFRDFGRYQGAYGRLRRRLLYRSGSLDRATDADLDRLHRVCGIATIVDLRRCSERRAAPSRRPADFAGVVIEADDDDELESPHLRYLAGPELSAELLKERMLDFYRTAPFDRVHRALFGNALRAVATSQTAVLVHCAAGKDRTGLFVAIVQFILGVSSPDRMREYLASGDDRSLVETLNRWALGVARSRGIELRSEIAELLTSVHRWKLEASWNSILEAYGSVDAYLDSIGVDAPCRDALRARYVEV